MECTMLKQVLMEAATDGAGPATGGAAPAPTAAPDVPAQPPSLLATGAGESAPAAGNPADPFGWLPEKHRVLGEDKTLNVEASAKKLAEAYTGLEKRLGDVGMPPKTADEYKPEGLPETVKLDELMADEGTKSFLKRCHAKGMTNAQVSEVLAFGLQEWAPQLLKSDATQTAETATAALREAWTDEGAFKENISLAYKAATTVASKAGFSYEDLAAAGLDNNPTFIRLMAALGPEIGEDKSPTGSAPTPDEAQTIRSLEASEAYRNPKHIDHERVSAQIRAFYQRKYTGLAE
jgi:hypothetical protein